MNGITLEELKVIIDAETKAFREELAKVKSDLNKTKGEATNSTNKIKSMFSGLKKFLVGLGIGTAFVKIGTASTKMAISVEASVQQISNLLGESAQAFMRWGKENALALNMSQSEFAQYGSVYANLLSSFISSTSGVASHTADLLKASAIIQSATGRTMTDVMERIRSGLLGNTEAIEDLGINVNVAMIESTDAFKKFAGDKSWQQLDFQTQQQIRLMAILEQTTKKYGDSVQQNTTSRLATLSAIIKDITLNIGNGLLPVLNLVLPVITKIAMAVRTATEYFSTFMQMLFGYSNTSNSVSNLTDAQDKYNSSLEGTAESATKAKKALGGLMGLDELNVITTQNESSDSTSSEIGLNTSFGEDLFAEEPDTSGVQKAVNTVKRKFNEFKQFIKVNTPVISSLLVGMVSGFIALQIPGLIASMIGPITALVAGLTNFWLAAKNFGWFKTILSGIGMAFGGLNWKVVAITAAIAAVSSALVYLYQTSETFRDTVNSAFGKVQGVLQKLWDNVLTPLFDLCADFFDAVIKPLASFLVEVFVKAVEAVATVALSFWENIIVPLAAFLVDVLTIALKGVVDIWEAWKPTIEKIAGIVETVWKKYLAPFVDFVVQNFCKAFEDTKKKLEPVLRGIGELLNGVVDVIKKIPEKVTTTVSAVKDAAFDSVKTAWESLQSSEVVKTIKGSISSAFTSAKNSWNSIVDKTVTLSMSISATISNVKGWINSNVITPLNNQLDKSSLTSWINIPYLAYGGVVNKATLGIFGEAGEEAVVPLERNTVGIQKIAQRLSENMSYNSDGEIEEMLLVIIRLLEGLEFDPVIEADGVRIAEVVNKANKRLKRRQGYSY